MSMPASESRAAQRDLVRRGYDAISHVYRNDLGELSCASSMGPPERQWHGTTSSGCHRRRRDDRGVGGVGSSASLVVTPGFWRCR